MKELGVLQLTTLSCAESGADSAEIIQSRASANLKASETAAVISTPPTRPRLENAAHSKRLVLLS